MEMTRIQIRPPRGSDPGKVLERHFKVIGDTVLLCDASGNPLVADDDKLECKLAEGENPKQVASVLLRRFYNATRVGPVNFNRPIRYPRLGKI